MKSEKQIRKIIKLLVFIVGGAILYFLGIQLLSLLFVSRVGFRVSWGIAIYYSYFLFFGLLLMSVFTVLVKEKIIYWSIIIIGFLSFVYYWKDTYTVYPNRTVAILGLALLIYSVIQLIANKYC